MKNRFKGLILIVAAMISMKSWAQQEPQFTQSFDNMIYVNPAYAGSRGMMNITDINREQWVGFDGNPRSTTISLNSPVFNESFGAGLSFVNDQVGPVKQSMLFADFAYNIKVNNKGGRLAFGLKGGMNMINISTASLVTTDPNDPNLIANVRNRINPNFGFGMFYHSSKWYVGVSTPKMLQKSYDGISTTNVEQRHYYGILGGIIRLNDMWKLKPTSQVRVTPGSPINVDLSLAALYNDRFWFGGLYRLNAAYGAFVQVQVTPQFKIGLASDFDTGNIRSYNTGSFELLASYDFTFKKEGIRSPRYF